MSIRKPLLPECFLHWTDPPGAGGEETLRLASWRRSLTLKGKAFREFESEVLPLLTGAFTVDEICARAAHVFRREDLVAALDMLAAQGILVEGQEDAGMPSGPAPQLGWLSETAPEGRAAQKRLTDARVVLFGAGAQGAVAARALVAAGVGRLTVVDPADAGPADPYFSGLYRPGDIGRNRAVALADALTRTGARTELHPHAARPADAEAVRALVAGASLALCCLGSGELTLAHQLNIACREEAVPWIASSLEGTELVVGPGFFHAGGGPCYMCWRLREAAGAANLQTRLALEMHLGQLQADLSGRRENLAPAADIVGGMLSAEAIAWLTGSGPPGLDGRLVTVALPGLRVERHAVLRKPGCPVCGTEGGPP